MEREKLIQAIESYEKIHTISFKRPVQLKPAQISNALKKIVCDTNVNTSDVVALMDTTLMGSGKSGYLLTSRYLYSSFQMSRVALDGLASCEIRKKNRIHLTYQDGTETDFVISIYTEFEDLFRRIIQMQKEKPAAQEYKSQEYKSQAQAIWEKTMQEEAAKRKAALEKIARDAADKEKAELERKKAAREEAERQKAAQLKAEQEAAARRNAEQEMAERERETQAKAEQGMAERANAASMAAGVHEEDAAERLQKIDALKEQASLAWEENPQKAVQYLHKAAALGDAPSLCELADAYCYGEGTDCDIQKAKQLYQIAARMGIQKGMDALETIKYYEQMDVEELYALADDWDAEPMYSVMYAQMAYDRGLDVERYIELQVKWAYQFSENEQYFYAFPFYQRAAKKGDSNSQYQLGVMYFFDLGWEYDEDAAKEWFRKAAANGHEKACSVLEQMDAAQQCIERIENSKSVLGSSPHVFAAEADAAFRRKRYMESYCLFRYIISKEFKEKATALMSIADMYQKGQGPLPCKWKARCIYETLSKEGNRSAQYKLGEICWEERCYNAAADQYEKAAEQGHSMAQLRLADMYDKGVGRKKDKIKAAYWYEKAAEKNIRRAQETISQMYQKGIGVPKNKKQAQYWADRAANWQGY